MKKLEKLSNGMFNALPTNQMGNLWGGAASSSTTTWNTPNGDTIPGSHTDTACWSDSTKNGVAVGDWVRSTC